MVRRGGARETGEQTSFVIVVPEASVNVVGIGMDAVELDRFRLALARRAGLKDRLFSDAERSYSERKTDPTERYAARFAAKEAVMKAMGVGLWKFKLRDVEVAKARSGAPSIRLHGRAAEMAVERGITGWLLTMTHTEKTAFAIAVALREVSAP